jgi:hypothetical protein
LAMWRLRRRGFTLGRSRVGEVEALLWEGVYFYLLVGSCIPDRSQLLVWRVGKMNAGCTRGIQTGL